MPRAGGFRVPGFAILSVTSRIPSATVRDSFRLGSLSASDTVDASLRRRAGGLGDPGGWSGMRVAPATAFQDAVVRRAFAPPVLTWARARMGRERRWRRERRSRRGERTAIAQRRCGLPTCLSPPTRTEDPEATHQPEPERQRVQNPNDVLL